MIRVSIRDRAWKSNGSADPGLLADSRPERNLCMSAFEGSKIFTARNLLKPSSFSLEIEPVRFYCHNADPAVPMPARPNGPSVGESDRLAEEGGV